MFFQAKVEKAEDFYWYGSTHYLHFAEPERLSLN
jgi:hypothetical protein